MTSSALAERPAAPLLGEQRPRILWAPPSVSTELGREAVELAATAGLILDPWEAWFLEQALAEKATDRWAAFEVALLVSRQNGKGSIIEAMELAGLYLLDERLILHSAHEYKTAAEGFRRIRALIDSSDEFSRRVQRVRTSHGEEGIELLGGRRLRFVARTGGSGRGFTGDRVILDEAQHLSDAALEALMPTMSARPNPQLVYMLTAPDKDLAPCEPVTRIRKRAIRGGDQSLFYAEWSIDPHDEFCPPGCQAHDDPGSVASWLKANPGAGIRIPVEHMAREFASMGPRGYGRERLGVGNWPVDDAAWQVIGTELWASRTDVRSRLPEPPWPLAFAADMTLDQSAGAIGVVGARPDGLTHVEVVDPGRPGTEWIVDRLIGLNERFKPCAVVVDASGTAGRWIAPLEAAGVEVIKPSAREAAAACGQFYDAVAQGTMRHIDQPALASALAGAKRRPLGDAWAWARKTSSVDITPLVAVTLAAWGHATRAHLAPKPYNPLESIW